MDAVRSQHPNLSVFRPSTRNVFADNSAGKVAEGMRQEDSPYSQNGEPSMSSARTALSPEERQLSPTFSLPGPSAPTTSDAPQKDKLLQSLLDPADVDLDVDSPSVRSSNSRKLHLIKPRRKAPAAFPLNEDGMEHDGEFTQLWGHIMTNVG